MQNQYPTAEPASGEINLHLLDYWRVVQVRLPLIILVFLLVVITAGVATYLTPRQYRSSVIMQVKADDNIMHIFGGGDGMRMDPRFSETQFQIIQHKEVLYPVIDTMKLMQRWDINSRRAAYGKLSSMLNVSEVRNTDLIEISVMSTDRQEAADLANTIALEYQKKRIDEQQKWVARSLVQLEDEVNKQRKKTEDLRDEMSKIRLEGKINDLNPESTEDPKQVEEGILQGLESKVSESRMAVALARTKQQQIQGMTDDQIMHGLKTFGLSDETVAQLLPVYESSVSQESQLLHSGLGINHPSVQSLHARTKIYENQLKDQIGIIRKSQATALELAEKSLEAEELRLADARSGQLNSKSKVLNYQEAKNQYLKAKRILEAAEGRYSTETMQRTMPQSPATIWEKAEVSDVPAKPKVFKNMLLAVACGIALGVGLAFLIEYLDMSVKTMEDLESALGVPVLAVIPKDVAMLKNAPHDCPDGEGYRIMRTNIEFKRPSPDANTITFVSGGVGEGKSTTLNNLAITFARGGYKTLIVDADLRRPSQHRLFDVPNDHGLTDYLSKDVALESLILPTPHKNLSLLPSGRLPVDASGLLNSQRMIDMIRKTKAEYDMVLFDSPPILGVSDASVLASSVDMTIIVVQHRRFPRSMLARVKQVLANVGARVIGCVLNNTDTRHDAYYEYYTSYYQYYSPDRSANTRDEQENALEKGEKHPKGKTDETEGDY